MSGRSPGTWFAGKSNPEFDDERETGWGLVVAVIAILILAPLPLIVAAILYFTFQIGRVSYKVFAAVAVVYWAIMFIIYRPISNMLESYKEPYVALLDDLENREWTGDLGSIFIAHAPLGIGTGLILGTAYCFYRWIRRPAWEQKDLRQTPWEYLRRRSTMKKIAADVESPKDGATVGVDPDGRRLVQTDREASAHTFVTGASGAGKALDVNTPIPLAGGGYAMMGDLLPGVRILDENGNPCTVTGAFSVMHDHSCLEVAFNDGSVIVADEEHLWTVHLTGHNDDQDVVKTVTTGELRWWHNSYRNTMGRVLVRGGFRGDESRTLVRVTPVESRPVRCISVDSPSRLFLAGPYGVPTHNTRTLLTQARDVIKRGHSYVYVDLKGGPDVPIALADYAARYGRRFLHFAIQDSRLPYDGPADGPAYYDPAGRGDPSRRKDLLVGAKVWDVEYYKQVVANYLQTAFRVAAIVPPAPGVGTFEDLVVLLQPDRLADRCSRIPTTHRDYPVLYGEVDRLVNGSEAQERSGVRSMLAYIQTFVGSTAGAWLRKDPTGERDIDFRRAADEGWVVCFSLDKANYAESSAAIAGLVVQDLNTMSSELRNSPPPMPMHIVFDEFQAIGSDNILGFIDTCRDAYMSVTMSTQALGNLNAIDDNFANRVIGIVNCFIVHRANHLDDAEIFAGLTGQEKKFKKTIDIEHRSAMVGGSIGMGAATGAGRIEEYDEFRVLPKDILELGVGELVYIAKSPEFKVVYPVQVVLENPTAVLNSPPPSAGRGLPFRRGKDREVGEVDAVFTGTTVSPYVEGVNSSEPVNEYEASYNPDDYWRNDPLANQQLGAVMDAVAAAPRSPRDIPGDPISLWRTLEDQSPPVDIPDPNQGVPVKKTEPLKDSSSVRPAAPSPRQGGLPTSPRPAQPAAPPSAPARPQPPRPAGVGAQPPASGALRPVSGGGALPKPPPPPARRPMPPAAAPAGSAPRPAAVRPPQPPAAQANPAASGSPKPGKPNSAGKPADVLDALGVPDPSEYKPNTRGK